MLCDAIIPDEEFHSDLIDCQLKVLKRFLGNGERKEVEKMLLLKAEDYGFEPGVTGFEESNNLAYLDGERDAKLEVVRKGLMGGVDEGIISSLTGFSIDQLRETKRRL